MTPKKQIASTPPPPPPLSVAPDLLKYPVGLCMVSGSQGRSQERSQATLSGQFPTPLCRVMQIPT